MHDKTQQAIKRLREVYNTSLKVSGGFLYSKATRQQIIEEARTWLNVPWRHQGRNRVGVDCIGLIVEVCKQLQLMNYDVVGYAKTTRQEEFVSHFRAVMNEKPVVQREIGDVLLVRDGIYAGHSVILSSMYGHEAIIHACVKNRKVVEEPLTPDVLVKVNYCFKLPNLLEEK